METSGKKKHWLRRKWGVLLILGVVTSLVAGGVWVAFFRGQARAGLFEKGVAAWRAGDLDEAEQHFRSVLATQPGNAKARSALLSLLMEARRYDEAEAVTRAWMEAEGDPIEARTLLVEIAVRRLQLDDAERMARAMADVAPQFAQLTILRIRDARGSFLDRLQSAEAAISLASLGGSPAQRADLHLHAAETLLDLAERAPEAVRAPMRARAEQYRGIAEDVLKASGLRGEALRRGMARARLLARDESERAFGARTLTEALGRGETDERGTTDRAVLRAALARYHTANADWGEAVAVIRALREDSPLAWVRAVRRVVERGPAELALELLGEPTDGENSPVVLLRAQALLRGTEAQRELGSRLLTDLVEGERAGSALGIRAYRLLAAGGNEEAGLDLLETVADRTSDVRAEALLASGLVGDAASRDRAMRMIDALPARVASVGETVEVLRLLRKGGREAVARFLAAEVRSEGREGSRRRLLRAAACAALRATSSDAAERERLREAAVADLRAVEGQDAEKSDLARAWVLALDVGEARLAGSLVGRAIALRGAPHTLGFACVRLVDGVGDDVDLSAFSEGIVASAEGRGPARFLQLLGTAVASRPVDRDGLRKGVAQLLEGPSAVPALSLAVRLDLDRDDRAAAEATARQLVQLLPEAPEARLLLGDVLVMRKDWSAVLELHPGATGSHFGVYRQRATALWELGRADEALEAARAALAAFPRRPDAHLLLANLHLRAERTEEALGVLSIAPVSRTVALLRARLLLARGEHLVPEMLYSAVLAHSPNDIQALQGMTTILRKERRGDELLALLAPRLDSPALAEDAPDRGAMLIMRAAAHEELGQYGSALADYVEALRVLPDNLAALNNAAWLILRDGEGDIAKAEAYVDRALAIAPTHASVLDTAAILHQRKEEYGKALAFIDGALRAREKPAYMERRSELLVALKRGDDARAQLEELVRKFPDSEEAERARERLRGMTVPR